MSSMSELGSAIVIVSIGLFVKVVPEKEEEKAKQKVISEKNGKFSSQKE